jgi:hypothetical protein
LAINVLKEKAIARVLILADPLDALAACIRGAVLKALLVTRPTKTLKSISLWNFIAWQNNESSSWGAMTRKGLVTSQRTVWSDGFFSD